MFMSSTCAIPSILINLASSPCTSRSNSGGNPATCSLVFSSKMSILWFSFIPSSLALISLIKSSKFLNKTLASCSCAKLSLTLLCQAVSFSLSFGKFGTLALVSNRLVIVATKLSVSLLKVSRGVSEILPVDKRLIVSTS